MPYDPAIPFWGMKTKTKILYTCVQSSIILSNQKSESDPSAHQQMDSEEKGEDNINHMMEYYSALTRKEILIYATTWMNSVNIVLSETNETQNEKYDSTLMRF